MLASVSNLLHANVRTVEKTGETEVSAMPLGSLAMESDKLDRWTVFVNLRQLSGGNPMGVSENKKHHKSSRNLWSCFTEKPSKKQCETQLVSVYP